MKRITTLAIALIITISTFAQITLEDYKRADSAVRFNRLVYNEYIYTHWQKYALPIQQPCLFQIEEAVKIPVNTIAFLNQFSISNLKWAPDSKSFTFEFNERGHPLHRWQMPS